MYKLIESELFGTIGLNGNTIVFALKTYIDEKTNKNFYKGFVTNDNALIDETPFKEDKSIVKGILENFKIKYSLKK